MKDYPYFKAYVAEILLDTIGMTFDEKGRYLDNLLIAWKTSDPSKMPSWMQEYADETIRKSAKLSENSKTRWNNAMQLHSKSNANAMQTQYIEERRGEDRIREDRRKPPISPLGGFTDFWDAYPKKVDKKGSERSFAKAIKKTTLGVMLLSIESQKQTDQWQKNGGQFIPNPTTWLNQERWNQTIEIEDTQSWEYLNQELLKGANGGQNNIAIGRDNQSL